MGYLVGCCEWIENNFYVMVCVWSNATTITYSLGTSRNYEPLWFVIQLAIGAAFHVRGGITFWKTMNACAVCTALIILVYIFGAMTSHTDQFYNSPFEGKPEYTFQGGAGAFFRSLHAPTWFYIGCETSMIAVSKINNGTDVVPKALRMTFVGLAVISFWMLFCVKATQTEDWSNLVGSNYPLSYGFAKNLHWDYRLAALLTIPPNMSSILGFLYASELTTHSMAMSGLMPIYLRKTNGVNQVPLNALFSCVALQFVLLMYFWAVSSGKNSGVMFQVCLLGATLSYVGIFGAYIRFSNRYESMERKYRSPYGTIGAYVGILVFGVTFCSIVYSNLGNGGLYLFLAFVLVISVYYYFYAESHQCFSIIEQRSFMKAYILNANKKRKLSRWSRFCYDIQDLWTTFCCGCGINESGQVVCAYPLCLVREGDTRCCCGMGCILPDHQRRLHSTSASPKHLRNNRQYYQQQQRFQSRKGFTGVSMISNSTTTTSGGTSSSCTSSPNNTFNLRSALFATPAKPEAPVAPATTTVSPPVKVEASIKEDELLSMPINPPISAKKTGDASPMVPLSKAKSMQMFTRSFRHSVVEDDPEAEPDRFFDVVSCKDDDRGGDDAEDDDPDDPDDHDAGAAAVHAMDPPYKYQSPPRTSGKHDDAMLRSVDPGDEVDDEERRDVYVLDDEKHSDADEGHQSRGSSRRSSGRSSQRGSDNPSTASAKGLLHKASSWITLPLWFPASLLSGSTATAQGNASRVVPMTSTSLDFHPQHQRPPPATLQPSFPIPARIDTSAAPYVAHHRHPHGQEAV